MYDRPVMRKDLEADEDQVLGEFLHHQYKCQRCRRAIEESEFLDAGEKIYLCRRGWGYAYTLHTYIYSQNGKFYSETYPKYILHEGRKYIRVLRMPEDSLPARLLLEALEYGVRIGRVREKLDRPLNSVRFEYNYNDRRHGYGSLYEEDEMYRGGYGSKKASYIYNQ